MEISLDDSRDENEAEMIRARVESELKVRASIKEVDGAKILVVDAPDVQVFTPVFRIMHAVHTEATNAARGILPEPSTQAPRPKRRCLTADKVFPQYVPSTSELVGPDMPMVDPID